MVAGAVEVKYLGNNAQDFAISKDAKGLERSGDDESHVIFLAFQQVSGLLEAL